jgi:hypothetical protein
VGEVVAERVSTKDQLGLRQWPRARHAVWPGPSHSSAVIDLANGFAPAHIAELVGPVPRLGNDVPFPDEDAADRYFA